MRPLVLAVALAVLVPGACAQAADEPSPAKSKSVRELLKALAAELPNQRLEAAKALAAKGAEALPAVRKALKSKDWRVRRSACDALAEMKAEAKAAVPALTEALKDKDAWVRDGAAVALGRIGRDAKDAAKALAEAVKDKDIWVRESAMTALRSVTTDKAILLPAAVEAVKVRESGWSVKRHAMAVLWQHGKQYKPAVPALVAMLADPPEGMWDCTPRAVDLLAGMGAADKAVPILVKMLTSKNRGRPNKAISLLAKMGKAAAPAVAALENVARKHEDRRVREAARKAVEQIRKATSTTQPKKQEQSR